MTQTTWICRWPMRLTAAALSLTVLLSAGDLQGEGPTSLRYTRTVLAIQQAEPAVVNIEGNKTVARSISNRSSAGRGVSARSEGESVNGMGAGVIVDPRGYILTNQHVVQDVSRIEVTMHDGRQFIARLMARDAETDLALVKIDSDDSLPCIRCGTSSDLMRGEPVIAIGNPFGYHHTVTEGIISALHRDIPVNGVQEYPDLIQTDASINPGNSGGPLLNAEGQMIGINAAVRIGAQGIGFAIPIDRASEVAADMVAANRGGLEVPIHVRTRYDEGKSHLLVVSGSTSELKAGDVLLEVDERPVKNRLEFELALVDALAGDELPVVFRRDGQRQTGSISLRRRRDGTRARLASTGSTQSQIYQILGLQLEPANSAEVQQINRDYSGGFRVSYVRRESPAHRAQIRQGDILVGLLEWQTADWNGLRWILESDKLRSSTSATFHIMRGREVFRGKLELLSSSSR